MQCGKSCRRSNCDKFTLIGSWTVVESNNTLCVQRFWTLLAIFVSGSVQLSWRGWKPLCFGLRARIRKAQKLLRRGRWRRRSWRLLEGNAGEGNDWVLFGFQVKYSITLQGASPALPSSNLQLLLLHLPPLNISCVFLFLCLFQNLTGDDFFDNFDIYSEM